MNRIKGETKNLMQKILQQYEIKEKFLFEIVKTVAQKIQVAYRKFITAHLELRKLNMITPKLLAKFSSIQY